MREIDHAAELTPIMARQRRSREKRIQNDILRAFGTRRDMRIWRANSGAARFEDRQVRFGVKGQADLTGILPGGIRLEIEVKAADGRQTQEQKWFEEMVRHMNGVYVLARSVQDVWAAIGKYLAGGPDGQT